MGYNDRCPIRYCYSVGKVNSGYQSTGGLVGDNEGVGMVTDSYWDVETSGQADSDGGKGATSDEMRMARTFVAWEHQNAWTIDEGNDYPRLIWEQRPGSPLPKLTDFVMGSGTITDPFVIMTAEQLNVIGLFPNEWGREYGCFELGANIDLADIPAGEINLIGTDDDIRKIFQGLFDGRGHTISNLNYSSPETDSVGLFRMTRGVIKNLGLVDPNISGGDKVGALVGSSSGRVENCWVQGGQVSGYSNVGGLVGLGGARITNCYANTTVVGSDSVGGLAGWLLQNMIDCYSAGYVIGTTKIGGIAGVNHAEIIDSYWDTEVSGEPNMCGPQDGFGTGCGPSYGKITAQMKQQSTFQNWDFINAWDIGENQTYPYLRIAPAADTDKDGIVNFFDFCVMAEQWMKGE